MMNKCVKISIFLILLFFSNLYLLRDGFWFFQDAGFWAKTGQESLVILGQQFHNFTTFGYAMGYDQGLFSFTRIAVSGFQTIFFFIFGYSGSQIAYSIFGSILTFISFYFFSGIFFKDKKLRYVLSLAYVFSPWSYMTQGYIFYSALAPLFIYSFYKFFFESRELRAKYLLLNIFAAYIWVAYIRFIQGYAFIIIPYLLYLAFNNRDKLNLKKIAIYFVSCFLVFVPTVFAFVSQLLEKSNTAFNYGSFYGSFVVKDKMYNAFNLFQSIGAKFYEGWWWPVLGIILFAYIVYLILTFSKSRHSYFYLLNLALILTGITMYGLGNIFGNVIYLKVIHFLPFITNEPYWAMSILGVPVVMLVGLLTKDRMKYLYVFAFFFVVLATLPLLNLSDFQLQKFNLAKIPSPYYDYFIKPNNGTTEPTHFIPSYCWRAQFMDEANVSTFCVNYGLRYIPISYSNSRLLSGKEYFLSQQIENNTNIDNLRVTHNLKNIIIANDVVKTKGPGPLTSDKDIQVIKKENNILGKNKLLSLSSNENFNNYFFTNKNDYDFTIYSPRSVIYKNRLEDIFDNSLKINELPVVIDNKSTKLQTSYQSAKISYKIDPLNQTKYYVKISNFDYSKPFIIQMNQSFNNNWKVVFVDKNYFNELPCTSFWQAFSITNNERCQYKDSLINLFDIRLLFKQTLAKQSHFEGNFIGNGWVASPNDIPKSLRSSRDLYLVIIYQKQIYYAYTIIIAGLAFVIIFILMCFQELRLRLRKRTQ